MSAKNLVHALMLLTFLAATALIHPSIPFLLLAPTLALGAAWWSGALRSQ